ncbi:MAG: hypothetical protein NT027_07930 [Proteobacteria bacterium]|nr:hypothetical protein [Pseudomonadota bacterium]
MSYIDTIKHEYLGQFGSRSVYRILENVAGSRDDFDFGCTSTDLVIGGGSGEVPAIIFSDLDYCVGHFLLEWLHQQFALKSEEDVIRRLRVGGLDPEKIRTQISELAEAPHKQKIAFAGWSALDYYEAVKEYSSSPIAHPYRKDSVPFEHWLAQNIGEYAFFEMSQHLKASAELRPLLSELVEPLFENFHNDLN